MENNCQSSMLSAKSAPLPYNSNDYGINKKILTVSSESIYLLHSTFNREHKL